MSFTRQFGQPQSAASPWTSGAPPGLQQQGQQQQQQQHQQQQQQQPNQQPGGLPMMFQQPMGAFDLSAPVWPGAAQQHVGAPPNHQPWMAGAQQVQFVPNPAFIAPNIMQQQNMRLQTGRQIMQNQMLKQQHQHQQQQHHQQQQQQQHQQQQQQLHHHQLNQRSMHQRSLSAPRMGSNGFKRQMNQNNSFGGGQHNNNSNNHNNNNNNYHSANRRQQKNQNYQRNSNDSNNNISSNNSNNQNEPKNQKGPNQSNNNNKQNRPQQQQQQNQSSHNPQQQNQQKSGTRKVTRLARKQNLADKMAKAPNANNGNVKQAKLARQAKLQSAKGGDHEKGSRPVDQSNAPGAPSKTAIRKKLKLEARKAAESLDKSSLPVVRATKKEQDTDPAKNGEDGHKSVDDRIDQGQLKCVPAVFGFVCKLCDVFLRDKVARREHIDSTDHMDKYKVHEESELQKSAASQQECAAAEIKEETTQDGNEGSGGGGDNPIVEQPKVESSDGKVPNEPAKDDNAEADSAENPVVEQDKSDSSGLKPEA